jgi:hypothetical protein
MTGDPYSRAIRDFYHDEYEEPLIQRDGAKAIEHPLKSLYFTEVTAEDEGVEWAASWLDGPMIDMGAGVGRHTLYYQDRFEVVAIEVSDFLVETMRDRGVNDARRADMFELRDTFERDRFQSAFAHGTQVGLAGSMQGLRQFLGEIAFVTRSDATASIDCYDPNYDATKDLLGYRSDPTAGLAYRVMQFEYEDDIGEPLLFRLFSPDRVREATVGTGWSVAAVRHSPDENKHHYRAALSKE